MIEKYSSMIISHSKYYLITLLQTLDIECILKMAMKAAQLFERTDDFFFEYTEIYVS